MFLLLPLLISLGILFGLEPFGSFFWGLSAAILMVYLSKKVSTASYQQNLLLSIVLSLLIGFVPFHWVIIGTQNLSGSSLVSSLLLMIPYSILFNLKIPFFFIGAKLATPYLQKTSIFLYPILALTGDLLFYQVFPWYYGNIASGNKILLQSASIWGVYGIGFILFLLASLIVEVFTLWKSKEWNKLDRLSFAISVLLIAFVFGFGFYRLHYWDYKNGSVEIKVGIVQPNTGLGLKEKMQNNEFVQNSLNMVFNYTLKLIYQTKGNLDLIILPESSVPFFSTNPSTENKNKNIYSNTYRGIIQFLSKLGEVDIVYNEMDSKEGSLYNTFSLFSKEGFRSDSYYKQRLVPFGEYIPQYLGFLKWLFPETSNYQPYKNMRVLEYSYILDRKERELPLLNQEDLKQIENTVESAKNENRNSQFAKGNFIPLLCYEGMFPELVMDFFKENKNVDFLVNSVNDSWFGNGLENYQHYGAASIRAVETGRYLIRSSLSGISGVVDPKGMDTIEPIRLLEQDVRAFTVPLLRNSSTVYMQYGNWLNYILIVFFIGLVLFRNQS